MLLKRVYMGWKFQRTLKVDFSFSLEHFFISVAIFTQVASAPLRFSRSTFEIPEKIGKSSPRSVIVFGFVIVFIFLLAMTRSFFIMSAKSFCIMLKLMFRVSYYEIYNGRNWRMIRKCYPAACDYVICTKFIKETKFFPLNC